MKIELILMIYQIISFICLPLVICLAFFVFVGYTITRSVVSAKLSRSRAVELILCDDGTADMYVVRRKRGLNVDENGDFFQAYERLKKDKETDSKEIPKPKGWTEGKPVQPLDYYYRGIRIFIRRETDIPVISRDGKPASLDQSFLSWLRNIDRERILKRNKIFKSKAKAFPIIIILLLIIAFMVIYFLLMKFDLLSFI